MIGDLKSMPMPELLQWISQSKRTGTLKIRNNYITKRIYFKNGLVISSSSSDPRDYLGQFLLSRGWISEVQLIKAIEKQEKKKMMLGKILVESKIITEEQLKKAMHSKTLETIFSIFLWDEGKFEFSAGEFPSYELIPLNLDINDLILNGIKRKDEWKRILEVFKSVSVVLDKTKDKMPSLLEGNIIAEKFWNSLDGEKSLEEIALHMHCSDYEICSLAYKLYEVGLMKIIKIKEKKEEGFSLPADMLISFGEKKLKEGKYEEALNLLNYLTIKDPSVEPKVFDLKKEAEEKFVQEIKNTLIKLDARPYLLVSLEEVKKLNLSPQESFLLTRINGSWTVKEILCVIPFEESSALKNLRNLLFSKYIALKE